MIVAALIRSLSRPSNKTDEAKPESGNSRSATRRRDRSLSVSSQSETDSISESFPSRRGGFRDRRDSWRPDQPSPPLRRAGDSYIPSYSRLNRARPPPRKRADRRLSRDDGARRTDEAWHRSEQRERKIKPLPESREAAVEEVTMRPLAQPEWDPEDEISLGESDPESAPLVTPKDDLTRPSQPQEKAAGNQTQQPALSIRGLARTKPAMNGSGAEVDLIRDFGPDLLSRLSGSTRSTTVSTPSSLQSNSRLMNSQTTTSNAIQMKGRGFRKGTVSSETHATLMARLDEEKLRSGAMSPDQIRESPGGTINEKSEASLRQHVLQVLKQRREQAIMSGSLQAVEDKRAQDETSVASGVSKEAKSSRLALLQSRLAAEKAAISSPDPSIGGAADQPASAVTKPSDSPSTEQVIPSRGNGPAQRMAELKRRLAEQKAARSRA